MTQMTPEQYELFKEITSNACDAMIAARDAQVRGDVEQWNELSQKAIDLQQQANKMITN